MRNQEEEADMYYLENKKCYQQETWAEDQE